MKLTHLRRIKRTGISDVRNAFFSSWPLTGQVGNPREFLQAEKEEQEMAEACKRLIKNCIICWNYLYLSQKLEDSEDIASREAFLEAVANGLSGLLAAHQSARRI